MTDAVDVPEVSQDLWQPDAESLVTAVRSLGRRAAALDALIDSASVPTRLDTVRVDITVDAAAYFAAVEVAAPPVIKEAAT